jgi:hypothetical protein
VEYKVESSSLRSNSMTWSANSNYTLSAKRNVVAGGQAGDAYVILQRRIYRYTPQTNVNVIGRKRGKKASVLSHVVS